MMSTSPTQHANSYLDETVRVSIELRRRKDWFPVLCLLIVAVSTLMQFGCLKNGLVIDDNTLVSDAGGRGCGNNPADCFKGKLFQLYYRPVLTSSFAYVQSHKWHNDEPKWFHLENLLLHALVVGLSLILFRVLLRSRTAALISGTIFGLHPVQVCVTTFIGGRTDLLALFFAFLFVLIMVKAGCLLKLSKQKPRKWLRPASWMLIGLSGICLAGAAFSKEQVIPIVLLCPLFLGYRISLRRRPFAGLRARCGKFPWWVVIYSAPVGLYAWASSVVLKGEELPRAEWSPMLHIEMVGRTLWYFVKTFFFPTITTLHQSTLGAWDEPQPVVMLLGYIAAALWIAGLARGWHDRRVRVMMLWTTLTLVSCINLIPIPSQFASPYRAEIPLFGLSGLVGYLLTSRCKLLVPGFIRRSVPTRGAQILLFICPALTWCVVTSMADVPKWHDERTLMEAELDADPNYVPARAALANYWAYPPEGHEKSLTQSLKLYDDCIDQLYGKGIKPDQIVAATRSKAMIRRMKSASGLRYVPTIYIPQVLRGRGGVYQNLNRVQDAISMYSAVHELTPEDEGNSYYLAMMYDQLGETAYVQRDFTGAVSNLRAALAVTPDNRDIRENLIKAYRTIGRKDKADAVFRQEDRFTGVVP